MADADADVFVQTPELTNTMTQTADDTTRISSSRRSRADCRKVPPPSRLYKVEALPCGTMKRLHVVCINVRDFVDVDIDMGEEECLLVAAEARTHCIEERMLQEAVVQKVAEATGMGEEMGERRRIAFSNLSRKVFLDRMAVADQRRAGWKERQEQIKAERLAKRKATQSAAPDAKKPRGRPPGAQNQSPSKSTELIQLEVASFAENGPPSERPPLETPAASAVGDEPELPPRVRKMQLDDDSTLDDLLSMHSDA